MMLKLILSVAVLVDVAGTYNRKYRSVTLSCDPTSPKKGESMTCKCINPANNGIEWWFNSSLVTTCSGSVGSCFPSRTEYTFTVSNDTFHAVKNSYKYAGCGGYTCRDVGGDEATVTTSITDFDSNAPLALAEPGSNKDGKIETTTNCLFKETDIKVKWFTVGGKNGVTREYKPEYYSTPSDCADATKICNGVKAVTLNIGFEHKEKSGDCVKFKLEIYHSAYVNNKIELTTSYEYCIDPIQTRTVISISLFVVVILFVTGLVIGVIKVKFKKCERWCSFLGEENELNWKVIIPLCFIIVGIGIITVWILQKLWRYNSSGGSSGDVELREDHPRHKTQRSNKPREMPPPPYRDKPMHGRQRQKNLCKDDQDLYIC